MSAPTPKNDQRAALRKAQFESDIGDPDITEDDYGNRTNVEVIPHINTSDDRSLIPREV